MDGSAMDELLAFLACPAECGDEDQWLLPMDLEPNEDALQATRLALDVTSVDGCDSLHISLTSPRFELTDERSCQFPGAVHNEVHLQLSDSNSDESLPHRPAKRRSRKQEIAGLRDQVTLLSRELSSLKQKAGIDVNAPVARVPATKTKELVTKMTNGLLLWEKLAAKQLERRQLSEEENRVLKEAVVTHIRRAKRLRQMLSKRAKEESSALVPALSRSAATTAVVFFRAENEQILRRFASEVDIIYAGIDDECRRAGMHRLSRPGTSSRHSVLDPNRWFLEIKEIRIVPFDYKEVGRVAWKNHGGSSDEKRSNESRRCYKFSYSHPSGPTLRISSTNLARRYIESEREIVVVRSMIQPGHGITMDCTNRMVIVPGPTSMGNPTSGIELYVTATGESTSGLYKVIAEIFPDGWEEDMGVGLWATALSRSLDEIENALVNEAVTGGLN